MSMRSHRITRCAVLAAASSLISCAQSSSVAPAPAATPSPATTTPPASTANFSIEDDLFAYKSLQADGEAIACDVAGYLSEGGTSAGHPQAIGADFSKGAKACDAVSVATKFSKHVIVVPSTSQALANFQVWRSTLLVMQDLINQSTELGPPVIPNTSGTSASAPSLASSLSLAGQALPLLQGILGLFGSSQTFTGVQGSIPDQALVNDVSRQLRNLGVYVLIPDTYSSFSIAGIDPASSPFISALARLLQEHATLQDVFQKNQAVITAAQKLDADKAARSVDVLKLVGSTGADRTAIQQDIENLNKEIEQLEGRLKGADVGKAQITATKAQSLISAIEAFLANLTGGSIAFSGQSAGSTPSTAPPTGGSATPALAQPTVSAPAAGSTPPILSVLAADGLARRLDVKPNTNLEPASDEWRLLWLKALESGGSLITSTNVFGSKPYFSGGAIAAYDLFRFDGGLSCSGVAFAYGGFVEAEKFETVFDTRGVDARKPLVFTRGGCAAEAADLH